MNSEQNNANTSNIQQSNKINYPQRGERTAQQNNNNIKDAILKSRFSSGNSEKQYTVPEHLELDDKKVLNYEKEIKRIIEMVKSANQMPFTNYYSIDRDNIIDALENLSQARNDLVDFMKRVKQNTKLFDERIEYANKYYVDTQKDCDDYKKRLYNELEEQKDKTIGEIEIKKATLENEIEKHAEAETARITKELEERVTQENVLREAVRQAEELRNETARAVNDIYEQVAIHIERIFVELENNIGNNLSVIQRLKNEIINSLR